MSVSKEAMAISKAEKERLDYWNSVDEQLRKSISDSEKIYRTNYWINIIIVAVGIVLVGFGIGQSIIQGASPTTVTFAGLGIADFVALFLVNPQKRLLTLLGDVGQIALIYKTWNQQNQIIDNAVYDQKTQQYRETDPDKIIKYINEYAQIGEEALSAIEKYVGNDSSTTTTTTTTPETTTPPTSGVTSTPGSTPTSTTTKSITINPKK